MYGLIMQHINISQFHIYHVITNVHIITLRYTKVGSKYELSQNSPRLTASSVSAMLMLIASVIVDGFDAVTRLRI